MSLYSRLDRLAADVAKLDRKVDSVSNAPQSQRTSVEGGSIDFNDDDGNLMAIVGSQDDGGNTINVISGPTPPTPVGFTVDVDHGKFIVHWSGDFDGDALAPSDWSRAEVHASQDPFFVPSRATARGSIVSAAGGEVTIGVLKGPWTIKMLAWSQAGKMSAPSAPVDVEVPGYGEIVLEEIDAAQTRIDNARAILVDGQETLGTKLDEADTALASLRDSLDNLDETTLPTLRQDLDAAEGRLSEAESDLTNAFGRLDAVPGQISDAQQAAIDAAAADAQAKANAARSAAEAAAAQDALSKANAARDAAIASASSDAQAKADAARQAAETAAKADAKAKADAAQAAAIAAAANDATQKANAAQSAAEAKAQAAQVAADAAMSEAESKASVDYILSRGTDLVTNGTGYLNDNTNFSAAVFDPADAPTGARGSFDTERSTSFQTDELMPVDSSRRYLMRLQVRQSNPSVTESIFYAGIAPYDGDGLFIRPENYHYNPASMARLAQDLRPGDTTAVIEPGSDWSDTYYSHFAAWNYVDAAGKTWKPGTYTRNVVSGGNPKVNGSTVSLPRAWAFDTVPAGEYVSANGGGGTYMYLAASAKVAPLEWTTFSGSTLKGAHDGTKGAAVRQLPEGTAGIRLTFLMSYQDRGVPEGEVSKQSLAAVSFSDATLALEEAEVAQAASAAAQAAANAAQTAAGSAQATADAAMSTANGLAKVLHGTTVATGTAPNGSIWWQHRGTLSGPVIGQWNQVNGSWVSTPISSEAIANLDVGKLTAGAAELATVVSQKIAAAVGRFLELDVGQLTVTGASKLASVVAEQIAADVGEFIRLEVGQLVAGEGVMDEAVIQKLFTDVVVAGISQAQEFIGENAILTGAVTAPKITASEELWAKIAQFVRIYAEQLDADAINGMVITAPTIQSARSGRRWVAGVDSIRVIDENEDVRTQLSPDGSTFKGEVEAETLVVNQGAEFKGNNTLSKGAKFTLAAGVTDPTAPPVVRPYWDGLEFTSANINGSNPVGLAWDGTNYITVGANRATSGVASYFTGVYAMKINGETGESSQLRCDFSAAAPNEQRVSEVFGVTCIGSELFFLGRYGYAGYVWVTDLDGVFKRRFPFEDMGYSQSNPLTYRPGIGNDGTNVVIAHCSDDGRLFIRFYNKTTGAKIGDSIVDNADQTKSDITGVYVGNADWGRKLVTVVKSATAKLPSFSATTGTYDGATTQFDAASPESTGVVFIDGKFRTLDPSGIIHEYADTNTGDGSSDWWATYYWYTDVDNDNIIGSSDYRSRMAPPARFRWPRRAMLKILGQPMPTGVSALGPALAKKATKPTRTDFSGPGWVPDRGKPSARYTDLPDNWTTFASPSDTNTFPESESSVLESASGTFRVQGDGSGHWGPLTMGRNGVMSGLIVTGEVVVAVDTGGTAKQFTISLPPGRFTKPPVVWAQASTGYPQLVSVGVPVVEITPTTFGLYFYRANTTETRVSWFAMDAE